MRISGWVIISVVAAVLVGGAAAVLGTRGAEEVGTIGADTKPGVTSDQAGQVVPVAQREAQNRPVAPGAPAAPPRPQAQPTPQAPQAPQGPRRMETTEYDSWVVTCDNTDVNGKPNRSCIASLRLLNQNREVMLSWDIGSDPQGQWVTAIHVPPGLTVRDGDKTVASPPIMVTNGIELKFGNSAARRLTYVSCGPQQCLALASIDDTFVKDALANANGKANITIYTGGGAVPFDVTIKGIDKAITSTRK